MAAPEDAPTRSRRPARRRVGIAVGVVLLAGLVAFALSRLELQRAGHALVTASPGWIALALVLMSLAMLMRSVSWRQTLRAALPDTPMPWGPVVRALMIGVMTSALVPGRIGEPTRVVVLSRRLDGRTTRLLPVVAGTVFSQTLINLLALVILLAVTITSVPLPSGHLAAIATALALPLVVCVLVIAGPRLLAFGRRSRSPRIAGAANWISRMLGLARQGLIVFARPRYGTGAVLGQLAAWALQWLACYMVILALGLQSQAGVAAAAAILLAVNLSAILPATPSNVGVFQAACLVVLAAYGVGAGQGLAYGIILQAVEVVTALILGVPALLKEGLSWRDIRRDAVRSELEQDL
ncbi:MAG TPA: lysylphosphatidylglycerol synthase transmembrane domain-containing protein [Solirubrobacteraceae bacterium]|jgi:phosphatidylinositol alpha-mannosyltransferase|nr:lysylphosphatidylglycerol synthase transmembrane domain-containing protein [Solirubrobacteraceae bacterium]